MSINPIEVVEKEFLLPVTYEVNGHVSIRANSLEEAIKKFNSMNGVDENGESLVIFFEEYVDDSLKLVTNDIEEIKEYMLTYHGIK